MRANVRLRPTSRTGAQPIMAGVLWGIATWWVFGMALSGFADGPSGPAAMPDMSQGDCAPGGATGGDNGWAGDPASILGFTTAAMKRGRWPWLR